MPDEPTEALDVVLDVIVVSYRTPELLERFLRSVEQYPPPGPFTVTVADVDPTPATAGHQRDVAGAATTTWVVHEDNVGYARACNAAAVGLTGQVVAFFNADTAFDNAACAARCVDVLDTHPEIGIVGPLQYDSSGRVTHAGIFGTLAAPAHRDFHQPVNSHHRADRRAVTVSGSAFFVRRSVWDELAWCPIYQESDPGSLGAMLQTPLYFEETFAAYHCQAHGYQVWYVGTAGMLHEWNASDPRDGSNAQKFFRSQAKFRQACEEHGIAHD